MAKKLSFSLSLFPVLSLPDFLYFSHSLSLICSLVLTRSFPDFLSFSPSLPVFFLSLSFSFTSLLLTQPFKSNFFSIWKCFLPVPPCIFCTESHRSGRCWGWRPSPPTLRPRPSCSRKSHREVWKWRHILVIVLLYNFNIMFPERLSLKRQRNEQSSGEKIVAWIISSIPSVRHYFWTMK